MLYRLHVGLFVKESRSHIGPIPTRYHGSEERRSLHDVSMSPIANVMSTNWIDAEVVGSRRSQYYWMVIPVGPSGGLRSSIYSVGVFTEEHQTGASAISLSPKGFHTGRFLQRYEG